MPIRESGELVTPADVQAAIRAAQHDCDRQRAAQEAALDAAHWKEAKDVDLAILAAQHWVRTLEAYRDRRFGDVAPPVPANVVQLQADVTERGRVYRLSVDRALRDPTREHVQDAFLAGRALNAASKVFSDARGEVATASLALVGNARNDLAELSDRPHLRDLFAGQRKT
jgi:hypothetical protein